MKRIIQIILVASLAWECRPEKASQDVISSSDIDSVESVEQVGVLSDTTDSGASDIPKGWQEFEVIFVYSDDYVSQKLGVTWLTLDSIEFRLLTEDELCDTQYWGEAKNMFPNADPEMDEDENSETYFANQFMFENDNHILGIRIADTKDKARINFADKTDTDTDCIPSPNLLLKRIEDDASK